APFREPTQKFLRGAAATALGDLGPAAKEAAPILREMLKDEGRTARVQSALAFWQIEGDLKGTLPVILEVLMDRSPGHHRNTAAFILGRMGPAAREAIPVLREAAQDPDVVVRTQALEALRKIETSEK